MTTSKLAKKLAFAALNDSRFELAESASFTFFGLKVTVERGDKASTLLEENIRLKSIVRSHESSLEHMQDAVADCSY